MPPGHRGDLGLLLPDAVLVFLAVVDVLEDVKDDLGHLLDVLELTSQLVKAAGEVD